MSKLFPELRERLLLAGVAPRHVRRYLAELAEHLADLTAEEIAAGRNRAEAESVAFLRLGDMDELARAMIEQRQFQSWSARAPWAMFGLAPFLLLAGCWSVALFILWSGWQAFLPEATTPLGVRVHGIANLYFQLGKAIYLGAPILTGWFIGVIAARQRLKTLWPAAGLAIVAWMGGTGQVHTFLAAPAQRAGHVSMNFVLGSLGHGIPDGLVHALVLLSITTFPYIVWHLRNAHRLA
ncbi:MAG TPA: permease prefix domain 1-containing protein [Acidobacteriaceae bacterium]|nr:permease prefix domain 1-containing protein [Acidobacteriaceae bacterium]